MFKNKKNLPQSQLECRRRRGKNRKKRSVFSILSSSLLYLIHVYQAAEFDSCLLLFHISFWELTCMSMYDWFAVGLLQNCWNEYL